VKDGYTRGEKDGEGERAQCGIAEIAATSCEEGEIRNFGVGVAWGEGEIFGGVTSGQRAHLRKKGRGNGTTYSGQEGGEKKEEVCQRPNGARGVNRSRGLRQGKGWGEGVNGKEPRRKNRKRRAAESSGHQSWGKRRRSRREKPCGGGDGQGVQGIEKKTSDLGKDRINEKRKKKRKKGWTEALSPEVGDQQPESAANASGAGEGTRSAQRENMGETRSNCQRENHTWGQLSRLKRRATVTGGAAASRLNPRSKRPLDPGARTPLSRGQGLACLDSSRSAGKCDIKDRQKS